LGAGCGESVIMRVIIGNGCIDGVGCCEEMVFVFLLASIPEFTIAFILKYLVSPGLGRLARLLSPLNCF